MQVDLERCIACGVCEETCPTGAIALQDKKVPIGFRPPLCIEACPVRTNVPMYINRIKEGAYEEAYRYISKRNPFPSICGRVCHHPCESACRRGRLDEPLAIRELKRFVADRFVLTDKSSQRGKEAIAIVGAGPAGLSAAWSLAKKGYGPTLFEKEPRAGGWMRYGIPDYRLPKDILDREITAILSLGIKTNYGVDLGKDLGFDSLKASGFKAVLIAVGSQRSKPLGIPGETLEGILQGLDLLRAFHRGERPTVRGETLVVGGGNVAIDSSRTALRLGASKVTILYRRGIEQMPSDREEIREAQKEGIKIKCLSKPIEFKSSDGKGLEVVCQEMVLGEPDETGRSKPIPKEDSTFSVYADTVICAVGQRSDLSFLGGRADQEEDRFTQLNPATLETGIPGVFAAGDVATGPATVIEAIAAGLRAATSIDQFLRGEALTGDFRDFPSREATAPFGVYDYPLKSNRTSSSLVSVQKRKGNFEEVDKGFSPKNATLEADRCWHCDLINDFPAFNEKCVRCNLCSVVCPTKAIPLSKEAIEGTAQCESCPVGCQIKEGFKGACQRYTNVAGRIETAAPLKFPERETLDEIRRNTALSTPLVSAVGAGDSYPDFKPAPVQALETIDEIDVVTVVTESPLTYSSILLKIDTDKSIGKEGAPVLFRKRPVGHVTTEQYGSKMISLGGINIMKTDYNALLTRLMVNIANREAFSLEVEDGASLQLQVGETPIINGRPADRMKVACGAAIMGIFGNQLKPLADDIIVLDYDITGLFSEGHVGQSLGFKYTGIRPPGKYGSPGRYFGTPGQGWGGTTVEDPLDAIEQYDKKKVWPGMKVLVLEVTGRHVAMLEADEKGDFHRIATPKEADEMRELIDTNSEPSLTSALYMGGCGGSARAGTTQNPIKLTRAVHEGCVKLTIGGVAAYVLPGGGINFMVDVGKMKWRSFTWVAVPAVVAPVEYTMEKSTFVEMGGHHQALRLLSDIKAEEAERWKRRSEKSPPAN
jgi:NADPH-dependent glutamate synthase beta subunit-like oxidoreductase